jgi:hypothetical protein
MKAEGLSGLPMASWLPIALGFRPIPWQLCEEAYRNILHMDRAIRGHCAAQQMVGELVGGPP